MKNYLLVFNIYQKQIIPFFFNSIQKHFTFSIFSGFAYVEFDDKESLIQALEFNGAQFGERNLKVNVANSKEKGGRGGKQQFYTLSKFGSITLTDKQLMSSISLQNIVQREVVKAFKSFHNIIC